MSGLAIRPITGQNGFSANHDAQASALNADAAGINDEAALALIETETVLDAEAAMAGAAESLPGALPVSFPPIRPFVASGTYKWSSMGLPPLFNSEELRLDVDGWYPQMTASGTRRTGLISRVDWIARLSVAGTNMWKGNIWYKDGNTSTSPYTSVEVTVSGPTPATRQAVVVYKAAHASFTRTFKYDSPYFHPIDFEFDFAQGEAPTVAINTADHPNRPASLPIENLTIENVFRRAGFNVTTSPGGQVPIAGAGANAQWSDAEMHDAMQVYWSKFADKPQWAAWVFFASLHEQGTSLGGIMFDDIGPNHRQGTAIFNDSFISGPPPGDKAPAAWVQRMIFWTAVHEMGHTFNLAHSWQKALGTPWIPLANEPEARSFMNYPYNVAGGQTAFFADFQFRFSDQELLFMRHAPMRFVQQGNADWFDHHGFQQEALDPEPGFRLQLRVNRDQPVYQFMEPVTLELKLTNISDQLQVVESDVLSSSHELVVILKKDGKPARQWLPYARYCGISDKKVLYAGDSLYESLYISSGLNGWDIAEPGWYTVQVALGAEGEQVLSNPLRIRVAPPRGYDEEFLSQDFFSDTVGRIIALDGSRALDSGNNTLREVAERLAGQRVSRHANLALGMALARNFKELVERNRAPEGIAIKVQPIQMAEASRRLNDALTEDAAEMAESLGHVDYKWYLDRYSALLAEHGEAQKAADTQTVLLDTLQKREVNGRKVLPVVLEEVAAQRDAYVAAEVAGGARKAAAVTKNGSRGPGKPRGTPNKRK